MLLYKPLLISLVSHKGETVAPSVGLQSQYPRASGGRGVCVQALDELKGKTCGLCGLFDGDQSNDFTMDSGTLATTPAAFGTSWKKTSVGEGESALLSRRPLRRRHCHPFSQKGI